MRLEAIKKAFKFETVKKTLTDLVLSTIAYALPTVVLTFFVQPILAKFISGDANGLFLTKISVIRLCVTVFCASLANVRLLLDKNYESKNRVGDFNFLLVVAVVISSIVTFFMNYYYDPTANVLDIFLSEIVLCLIFFHDYFSIEYRINIEYKKLVIDNFVLTVGFVISLAFIYFVHCWQLIFIIGYGVALVYVCATTKLWKEKFNRTDLLKGTTKKYTNISVSHFLSESVNYCDKLLIYPSLGGYQVSVYNAASIVGKAINLVSVPVQRVLLSYLIYKKEISKKKILGIIGIAISIFSVAFVVFYALSGVVINITYPKFYKDAKPYVAIVLIGILVNTLATFLNTILLRFLTSKFQIIFSLIRFIPYVAISVCFMSKIGLWAVCVAALIAAILRLSLIIIMLLYKVHSGPIRISENA